MSDLDEKFHDLEKSVDVISKRLESLCKLVLERIPQVSKTPDKDNFGGVKEVGMWEIDHSSTYGDTLEIKKHQEEFDELVKLLSKKNNFNLAPTVRVCKVIILDNDLKEIRTVYRVEKGSVWKYCAYLKKCSKINVDIVGKIQYEFEQEERSDY